MAYIERIVDAEVEEALVGAPVVVLEGPRACGKTESALRFVNSEARLDVDDALRALGLVEPGRILEGLQPRLIDEWHEVPAVWNHLRRAADRGPLGQFIVTGSAVPFDDGRRHSGAGRFDRVQMRPLSTFEWARSRQQSHPAVSLGSLLDGPVHVEPLAGSMVLDDWVAWSVRGGWPSHAAASLSASRRRNVSYISDTAAVDVARLDGVRHDPVRLERLMRSVARNVSTEATDSALAADAGLSRDTVAGYLDALQRVHVLEPQESWGPHLRSRVRLRKAPKLHFVDPSLALAALHAVPASLVNDVSFFGTVFESLAVRDVRVYAQANDASVRHYRDERGLEVDIIIDGGYKRWAACEVKLGASEAVVEGAAVSLLKFAADVDHDVMGEPSALVVLAGSGHAYTRPDGVHVIPLDCLGP